MQTPLVIGIAGGTASGKTTVARRIVEELTEALDAAQHDATGLDFAGLLREERQAHPAAGRVVLLDQDSYYREFADLPLEEKREINWDHPDAFDVPLFVAHIKALRAGQTIEKPAYSFVTYARDAAPTPVHPAPVLVVEGILVLGIDAIRRQLDVKLFVDADDDVRVIRRLMRDIKDRGRDFDSVVEQYFRTVRPMHHAFVEPSKRHADIISPHGGSNGIAVQMVVGALRARLGKAER
jgi:uridine kinase